MKTVKPEVSVAVSWWGNIRELREVLALAESGAGDADPTGIPDLSASLMTCTNA